MRAKNHPMSYKQKSSLFFVVSLALIGASVSGCRTSGETANVVTTPSASGTITIATTQVHMGSFFKAVDYGPYLVAKNKGWFEDALKPLNASVAYTEFQTLPTINESLSSDKIDVVFEAEPPAIVGKAAGINVKIAGISCNLTQEILVHKNSAITSAAQLRGKKIAVLAGTSSHYGILKIISKGGLKKGDVSIIDMPPPDAKAAFETSKVDAWAVWPPFVEQEELSGLGRTLGGGTAQINSIMAVRGGFLTEHPDLAKAANDVIEKTKVWMLANPKEAQEIIAKELNIPLNVIQKAWPRHNWKAQLDTAVVQDIQTKADFLKTEGFIKSDVNVKNDLIATP